MNNLGSNVRTLWRPRSLRGVEVDLGSARLERDRSISEKLRISSARRGGVCELVRLGGRAGMAS